METLWNADIYIMTLLKSDQNKRIHFKAFLSIFLLEKHMCIWCIGVSIELVLHVDKITIFL
jgi:hypothetical protein